MMKNGKHMMKGMPMKDSEMKGMMNGKKSGGKKGKK